MITDNIRHLVKEMANGHYTSCIYGWSEVVRIS